MPQTAFFPQALVIFWSAEKRCQPKNDARTLFSSTTTFPLNTTVVVYVLLRSSRFSPFIVMHSVIRYLLRNLPGSGSCDLSRLLARKITKGIHSCKRASLSCLITMVAKLCACILTILVSLLVLKNKIKKMGGGGVYCLYSYRSCSHY